MDIMAIVGVGLVGAVLSIVLKQYKPEFSIYISLISGMIILFALLAVLKPAVTTLQELLNTVQINEMYGEVLLKSLGICYITQLSVDSCKDAGESAIASKLELAGKAAIVITALPLFKSLATTVTGLIN